jgi:hypothetical protein
LKDLRKHKQQPAAYEINEKIKSNGKNPKKTLEKRETELLLKIEETEKKLSEKDEQIEGILSDFYEMKLEKDAELSESISDYVELLQRFESIRINYFHAVSLVPFYEHKLNQEILSKCDMQKELSDSKKMLESNSKKLLEEIKTQHFTLMTERSFFSETLQKIACNYDELVYMVTNLKNTAEVIQHESDNFRFMHADTLASAKFKIGEAVAASLKNPLKMFLLPAKIIKIASEKKEYDKSKQEIVR